MAWLNFSKNGVTTSAILLISAVGLLILWIVSRKKQQGPTVMPTQPRTPGTTPILPAPEIDRILVNAGYSTDMARWWTAISKHETGNFTSELFRKANNLFGMGVPKIRRSLRSGEYTASDAGNIRQFSAYATTADSVKDLVLYLQSFAYPVTFNSVDDLVAFMKSKNYFEVSVDSYLAGVKRYL